MITAEFNRIETPDDEDNELRSMIGAKITLIGAKITLYDDREFTGVYPAKSIIRMTSEHDWSQGRNNIHHEVTDRALFNVHSYHRDIGGEETLYARTSPHWGKQDGHVSNRYTWASGYRHMFTDLLLNQNDIRVVISAGGTHFQNDRWGPPAMNIHGDDVKGMTVIGGGGYLKTPDHKRGRYQHTARARTFDRGWFTPAGTWIDSEKEYLAREILGSTRPKPDGSRMPWYENFGF